MLEITSPRNLGLSDKRVYVGEQPIGSGGQGLVYRGVGFEHGKPLMEVAVKHCDRVTTIMNEFKLMKDIDHPNIIKYYDWDLHKDGRSFLVMERLDMSLDKLFITQDEQQLSNVSSLSLLSSSSSTSSSSSADSTSTIPFAIKLTDTVVKKITYALLSGVAHLHRNGILHRDIKPSNILISKQGIKISDFGFSRHTSHSSSANAAGHVFHTSPARLRTRIRPTYVQSDDMWSVGVTLMELGQLDIITMQQFTHIQDKKNLNNPRVFPEFEKEKLSVLKEIIEKCFGGVHSAAELLVQYQDYFGSIPNQSSDNFWENFNEREGDYDRAETPQFTGSTKISLTTFQLATSFDDISTSSTYLLLQHKAFKDKPEPGTFIQPKQNSVTKVVNSLPF
ncbi:hypothetical protein DFA_00392 [Cavenderia fasciculata]|uniref:Protein kinase domain-containing protein n=1 Tax=Cavenderia fasciculata TaxID=261658 RepID=F4PRN2_CACFS|nr:uncharacterized protein DFA_00392 [Cavenderia fasciculata]EGG20531.1 hypothetical protein DFA_00392 [Cavenderia fasciculata]|eukprot:XP_004358381.1 hypothetical protein DFA_00392 [Cavenderia fasciculata]